MTHMDGVRQFVVRGGIRDIRRHNEDGNAALGQRGLTGGDGFTAGLLWRQNHLAKDAAAPVYLAEINLLNALKSKVFRTICVAMRTTGA